MSPIPQSFANAKPPTTADEFKVAANRAANADEPRDAIRELARYAAEASRPRELVEAVAVLLRSGDNPGLIKQDGTTGLFLRACGFAKYNNGDGCLELTRSGDIFFQEVRRTVLGTHADRIQFSGSTAVQESTAFQDTTDPSFCPSDCGEPGCRVHPDMKKLPRGVLISWVRVVETRSGTTVTEDRTGPFFGVFVGYAAGAIVVRNINSKNIGHVLDRDQDFLDELTNVCGPGVSLSDGGNDWLNALDPGTDSIIGVEDFLNEKPCAPRMEF